MDTTVMDPVGGTTAMLPAERDHQAFERTAADRAAVNLALVSGYGLHAMYASGVALAIAEACEPYRDQLAGMIDIGHLDRLPDLARALRYVQGTLDGREEQLAGMPPGLVTEGYEVRGLLMDQAVAHARKQRFPSDLIVTVRQGSGYKDLVGDLNTLYLAYRARPENVGAGSAVEELDVQRAAELVEEIGRRLRPDELAEYSVRQLLDERNKLGFLLLEAVAQLRRAMEFLRFAEKDAAKFVPSLYVTGKPGSAGVAEIAPAPDLATVHEALHAQPDLPGPFVDDEDNPFAPDPE